MIIEKIKLKNYRQYKGETVLSFNHNENRNINIIIGSNGAGKTNLSNAIQWCFYGDEFIDEEDENSQFGILNMDVFKKLNHGDIEDVEVEISIKTDNNEIYTFTRIIKITKEKDENGKYQQVTVPFIGEEQKNGTRFSVYFHNQTASNKPSYDDRYPNRIVDKLMPERIKDYFFFDGEELENYFRSSEKSERIKKSIFRISQLDILQRIGERLEVLEREYRKSSKELSPDIEKITSQIESIEKRIDENKTMKSKKDELVVKLKDKRRKKIREYELAGGSNAKKLLKDVEELEIKISNMGGKLSEIELERRKIILGNSYIFLSHGAYEKAWEVFDQARKDKKIPPNIDTNFINKLIDQDGKCICGTDISKQTKSKEARENVLKLREQVSTLGDKASELMTIGRDIYNERFNSLRLKYNNFKQANLRYKEALDEREKKKKKLEEVKSQIIEGADLLKLENFEEKLDMLNNDITGEESDAKVLKMKIDEDTKLKDSLTAELEKMNAKIDQGKLINKLLNFCELSRKSANNIQTDIMDEIRTEISNKTEEYYKQLHWKKDEDIDIQIEDNYSIVALQDGFNKFGAFAAGEKALLAISFIFALNKVSGFHVPLVLDTALGRISTGPRANFAINLHEYMENTQILLLFTESEYSKEVQDNLKDHISSSYKIELESKYEAKLVEY